jgi:ABC-2 type transport system permease protein
MAGTFTIFRKEFADHFANKRFLLLFAMILFLSTASAYQGANLMRSNTNSNFLAIFSEGVSGSSFVYLMVLFGPLLGLSLSFDTINKERKSGSLSTILTQPIFRDSVINGKFLAGALALTIAILVTIGINVGIAIPLLGFGPTGVQAMGIIALSLITILYLCFWFVVGLLFSVVCKDTSTSILASVATWITFSILIFIFATFITNILVPVPTFNVANATMANSTVGGGFVTRVNPTLISARDVISSSVSRISPAYLYSQIATRFTGAAGGSFTGFTISISQFPREQTFNLANALTSSWPQILAIAVAMVVCFAASYALFLRSEIRPEG